jgi:hypothetical protein
MSVSKRGSRIALLSKQIIFKHVVKLHGNSYQDKSFVWWGNLRERDHLKESGVDGRIILRWICRKWTEGYGLDRVGLGEGRLAGACDCGNELRVA